MNFHELKTDSLMFDDIWKGLKTFDVRKNDRNFQMGDSIVLKEWDNTLRDYLDRWIEVIVVYVLLGGKFGIDRDYCVLGIKIVGKLDVASL